MPITPDPSSPFKTTGAITDLSADFLKKNYLFGLDFVDEDEKPWPDLKYQQKVINATSVFERETKVNVIRKIVTDEKHDYHVEDYSNFCFFQLYEYPVIDDPVNFPVVVRAVYPTGQFITEFPKEWVRLQSEHGQLHLVPTEGTLSQVILGRGGSYLPIIFRDMGYLPQLFRVDYYAGFADGMIPLDILDAIAKLATIEILTEAQDTVAGFGPGVTSVSAGIDGISQGMGVNPRGAFDVRISNYRRELYGEQTNVPGKLAGIREHYRGLTMRVA